LDADPKARAEQVKTQVRALYPSPDADVRRVNTWRRHGRRFACDYLRIPQPRNLPKAAPFSWAAYELRQDGEEMLFKHTLSKPPASPEDAARAGWRGNELVAFRLHLPARIRFHNSRYYDTNQVRDASRGNILTWEQRLGARRGGRQLCDTHTTPHT